MCLKHLSHPNISLLIATGTLITERSCIDPSGPDPGTRLPPRMFDGKAIIRRGMKNARSRHKGGRKPGNALPCGVILLTAAPKRSSPEIDHILTKRIEAIGIGWYRVIYRLVSYRLAFIPLL